MAITTKLDVFSLKIRKKGNRDEYLNLNDVAGFNLLSELSLHLQKNIYLFKIDEKAERTYRIEKNEYLDNSLYCRIKVGKFGEISEIIDTVSGSGVFQKEREHSDTIPLFFHIKEDSSGTSATIHIQRTNSRTLLPEIRSILTTVVEGLRENLFIVEIKPLKKSMNLSDFIKSESGEICSVNLTLNSNLDIEDLEPLNVIVKSKVRKSFPENIVKKILEASKNGNVHSLETLLPIEVRPLGLKSASIEVRSPRCGKTKVKLGDNINLPNTFQIESSQKDIDKSGNLNYDFLKGVSNKFMS